MKNYILTSKKLDKFFKESEEKLAIDRRFTAFIYSYKVTEELITVELKVSDQEVGKAVKKLFSQYFGHPRGKAELHVNNLPDSRLLPNKYGIANSGFIPVYHSPTNRSEAVTQLLLGETCLILDQSEDKTWLLIKMFYDGYIGWVSKHAVRTVNEKDFEKWQKLKKGTFLKKLVEIKEKPEINGTILRIGAISSRLPVLKTKNGWTSVSLPDKSTGWVKSNSVSTENIIKRKGAKDILNTAKIFLGTSYLWGGRTPSGIDCSGFVQMVYHLNGYELPRDSGLQFKCGIDAGTDLTKLKAGDLLFFGNNRNRITHVGIYTGEDLKFIHSSAYVRYGSLDSKDRLFDERLKSIFVGARRIINT